MGIKKLLNLYHVKGKFKLGMVVNPEIQAIKKLRKENSGYTARPSSSKPKQTKEMKHVI